MDSCAATTNWKEREENRIAGAGRLTRPCCHGNVEIATAVEACVGYIHTVAHFLGGQYNIPHGMAKSVRLPNVPEACGTVDHKKLHALAIAAGISNENERHAWTARQFIAVIQKNIPMMANHGEREANAMYPVPVLTTAEEREAFCHQVSDWSKKS